LRRRWIEPREDVPHGQLEAFCRGLRPALVTHAVRPFLHFRENPVTGLVMRRTSRWSRPEIHLCFGVCQRGRPIERGLRAREPVFDLVTAGEPEEGDAKERE